MPSRIASTPGATAGVGSSWGRSAARMIRAIRPRAPVGDLVLVDQRLEGAAAAAVTALGAAEVEGNAGRAGDIPGPGHELEGGVGSDVSAVATA